MPRIQPIIADIAATGGIPGRQATGADFGAGIGEGIANVGKGLQDYAIATSEAERKIKEKLEQQAERDADFEADKQIALARTQFVTRIKQLSDNPPAGGAGLTDQFVREFDDYRSKLLENSPSERASRRMFVGLENIKAGLVDNVIGLQSTLAGQARRTETEAIVGQAINNVRANPPLHTETVVSLFRMVDSMPIGEDDRNKWKATIKRNLADASVEGSIDALQRGNVPQDEIRRYRDEVQRDKGLQAMMSPQGYEQALNRLDQLGKQNGALAVQRLDGLLNDARAAAKDGRMTEIPEQAFAATYSEPSIAAERLDLYRQSQRLAAAVSGLATKTAPEIDRVLSEFEPRTTGEGYIERKQDYTTLMQAANQVMKQRDDDPAAYANRYDQKVSAAFQSYVQAPPAEKRGAAQQYAEEVIAFKNRMGIAVPGILPVAAAQGIVDQFISEQGSQNGAATIKALSDEWGKYWPQVYGQIAKGLPDTPLVIGSGMREGPAMRLSGLTTEKMAEITKGLPTTTQTDVKTYLDESFEQARMSLQATNPMSGLRTFGSFYDSAQKLATSYVSQDGMSPKEAARKAYNDVFGEKYEFIKSGNTYLRVPKGQDVSGVADGIKAFQRSELDKLNIIPFKSLAGLDEKQRKIATKDIIKDQGYWVTNEDESGAYLFVDGAPVLQRSGSPAPVGKQDGQLAEGNIDLAARPSVRNSDGSTSTVRSMSFNEDGKEVLIPTVVNGAVVSDQAAIAHYRKTGQHLGKFKTPESATKYAEALHSAQEQFYLGGTPIFRSWYALESMGRTAPVRPSREDIIRGLP